MDTRRRAAPLRSAVCDSMKRCSPRAGTKETNLVLLPSASRKEQVSSVTASPVSAVHAATRSKPTGATESTSTAYDKFAADNCMFGVAAGSETSRSSTPVTDLSGRCPSSRSSFATSVQPDGECGYPGDDDNEACDSKWDKESGSVSGDSKRLNDVDMAAARGALNSHVLRQSQLRHSISARPASGISSLGSCDNDDPTEDDEDLMDGDEGDWEGENDSLDAAVIAAVDGDLALAAFLIPHLHRDLRNAVRRKVISWQNASVPPGSTSLASGGSGSARGGSGGGSPSSSSRAHDRSSKQARKRRRRQSDNGEEQDDGADDRGGNDGNDISRLDDTDVMPMPLLACPFHKRDPAKYGIQHNMTSASRHDGYRACAGPGFKSIQRLKEHLKRKHTPVQCERCYYVFSGSDKTSCINELTKHRRREVPCEKGDPVLKEGISEAQWAALDKQNRKKNQEKHKLEKWYEIWRVLFPDIPDPDTPWYNDATPRMFPEPTGENEAFADLFLRILDHKVRQGDISFPGCNVDDVQQRLRNLVQQTYSTYISLHGPLSRTTDTSSSLTGTHHLQPSLVGGSTTHYSDPINSSLNPATATSRTTGTAVTQAHPYALNMATTATAGVSGVSYAVAPAAMSRQPSHHLQYHQATMQAQTMPAQVSANMGTTMAAASYSGMAQEDLSSYYNVAVAQWSTGIPYGATMQASHFNPQTSQLGQVDYYGQAGGYAPVNEADYGGTMP